MCRLTWVLKHCGSSCSWWLREFMQLVDRTQHVQLLDGMEDRLSWSWESSGCFSARSAYQTFFAGRVEVEGASQIWRSRAPATCKFFTWLAARERCWTADRLERRHLPRPVDCPFCDQASKTINHILLGCVLVRQVWLPIIDNWNKPNWLPTAEANLAKWWTEINPQHHLQKRKWTVILLVAWMLWKHRNDIVFNGASPSPEEVLKKIDLEGQSWRAAGLLRETGSLPVRVDGLASGE